MMNEHKIVIEMVVGRALPSASKLQEVLDEINRDIRMVFAHNDWYVEIKSVQVEKVIHEASSGNVFADLGLHDAVELNAHGRVGCLVVSLLRERDMEKRELAELLGVKQVDILHLMNGYFDLFSTATLLDFIARLEIGNE
jgi:predicted XRE-type DNA-binding protein